MPLAAAKLADVLRSRHGPLREAIASGQGADRLWLEVLGSGLSSGARWNGQPLGVFLAAELLRVRRRDGRTVALRANPAQMQYEERRAAQNVVLKARQMGISTWVAGRMLLRTLLLPGTLSLQVAHTQAAAEQMFGMVHRFQQLLPKPLREGLWRCSVANRRRMVFPALDSEYCVDSAANANAGRGMSVQNLHLSEVARWGADAADVLAGLRAGLAPGGELVLESTPNGAYGCFYDEWQRAGNSVVRHFLPWWLEPSYVGVDVAAEERSDDESAVAAREGLSGRQIGFRRTLLERFGRLARQEFAESAAECFLASGDCCFDGDAVARRLTQVAAPLSTADKGRLWEWMRPAIGRSYVVAVDPAGGGSDGDFSALQVLDLAHGWQCAEWQARASPRETAAMAAQVARSYNSAVLVVERNNHGHAVLAELAYESGFELYERDRQAGWLTNAVTRPRAVQMLDRWLSETPERVSSERLLVECRSFVRRPDGSSGAASGCHDDLVMAMAIALSVRTELLEGAGRRQG